MRFLAFLLFLGLVAGSARGTDFTTVERTIAREPNYATSEQRYALVIIGPELHDRVWLVRDGVDLYVDTNGNGDLTEPGEKLKPKTLRKPSEPLNYEIDELTIHGRTHRSVEISIEPLQEWNYLENAKRPEMIAAMENDPAAPTLSISLLVDAPHITREERSQFMAGGLDLGGPLVMSTLAAEAPIIHVGGPLEIRFHRHLPRLQRDRAVDVTTVVGSPGEGAGTFAVLVSEGLIPVSCLPRLEVTFAPKEPGAAPHRELYELKKRC